MDEQNTNSAEKKMAGCDDGEVYEREVSGADGFPGTPSPSGGGNTLGGSDAKPMKTGDKEVITQAPGKTVTTKEI